jgi:hypothetical protein
MVALVISTESMSLEFEDEGWPELKAIATLPVKPEVESSHPQSPVDLVQHDASPR